MKLVDTLKSTFEILVSDGCYPVDGLWKILLITY